MSEPPKAHRIRTPDPAAPLRTLTPARVGLAEPA